MRPLWNFAPVTDSRKKYLTNKVVLGGFLMICTFTILLKIIEGILLDIGFRNGRVHLGFWNDLKNWLPADIASPEYAAARTAVTHHPNTLWFLTQFTWLTTIVIVLYLALRFFELGDIVPRWLRWVVTQRTLTRLTIYDLIVCIVFWLGIFRSFNNSFQTDFRAFSIVITTLVHALIPLLLTTYAVIFLVRDASASLLKGRFVMQTLIFPIIYGCVYVLVTIIWDDPYRVTLMSEKLISGGFSAWATELWKFPIALGVIYILIGTLMTAHNYILIQFNKSYRFSTDFESQARLEARVERVKRLAARDFARQKRRAARGVSDNAS